MTDARAGLERVLRTVGWSAAVALLAVLLWAQRRADDRTAGPPARDGATLSGDDAAVRPDTMLAAPARTALQSLVAARGTDTLLLTADGVPDATVRAALGAARAAGVPFRWRLGSQASVAPLAISADAAVGAAGEGVVVRASRDAAVLPPRPSRRAAAPLVLRDAGGVLDSLPVAAVRDTARDTVRGASATAAWQLAQRGAALALSSGGVVARAAVAPAEGDSAERGVLRGGGSGRGARVLLVGTASWETKFVAAALEEAGWGVDGRVTLSPSGATTLGDGSVPDIRRHAVVVVLDSALVTTAARIPDAASLAAFAAAGGGVVFAGNGLGSAAARVLSPAWVGAVRPGIVGGVRSEAPLSGLDALALRAVAGAVVLRADTVDGREMPTVVVRRRGAGRVAAVAYRESWRWRMEGNDEGLAAHRRWWSDLVATVAPDGATAFRAADVTPGDAAPWADLVALAGPPAPTASAPVPASASAGRVWPDVRALLFVVAALALVGEWGSRRLRGAA